MDLARGLAVLFMVMVHTLWLYGTPTLNNSVFAAVIRFLGGAPSAPVLMFLMGTSFMLSRRSTLKGSLRRGCTLFFMAYVLNFLRGTLPASVGLRLSVISLGDIFVPPATLLWVVDVLHFAGLALILLALIRRFLPQPVIWLIMAGAIAAGSPWLWGRTSGWPPLDWLLTFLWGATSTVFFPVFPWLCYPLTGMAFGYWLAASTDQERLFKRAARIGLTLLFVGTAITLTRPAFHIGDYWRSGPGAVVWLIGFVLLWLFGCCWLIKRVPTNPFFHLLYSWSENVTVFYCFHWMIVTWGAIVVGYQKQELPAVILLMIAAAAATGLLTRIWVYWRTRWLPFPRSAGGP
ncbi:MAG: heparan-alpha-glucosaminide N-acetyltransferase domain-containing protein [Anaerolineae bacterium]|nr:heparan-alpha-glucosaminide N-acetyltransferase domain-containing protein [Anaerolineae bacterium]